MRKSLILLCCLLLICGGCIAAAHEVLSGHQEEVTLTEATLLGNPSAAEGLSVSTYLKSNDHLLWETRCLPGKRLQSNTDFRFSHTPAEDFFPYPGSNIELYLNYFSVSGVSEAMDAYFRSNKALAAVRDNTNPGETHTETVLLNDYSEFLPIEVSIDIPAYLYSAGSGFSYDESEENAPWETILEDLRNFFRIPIPPGLSQEISVTKDKEGNVYELHINTADYEPAPSLYTVSTQIGEALYFTFQSLDDGLGNTLDTSQIPGGYGIYRLPFTIYENGAYDSYGNRLRIHSDELSTICSIEKDTTVLELRASADQSRILMLTEKDGSYHLTVLDPETGALLQSLKIMNAAGEGDGLVNTRFQEDCIVIEDLDHRIALVEQDKTGKYRLVFCTDSNPFGQDFPFESQSGVSWNGEKLAIASYQTRSHNIGDDTRYITYDCGFLLAIINRQGKPVYLGSYKSSLDSSGDSALAYSCYNDGRGNQNKCTPMNSKTISLQWSEIE